jgi:type I restriction enzyme S subunit
VSWDTWQKPDGWTLSPLTEVADVTMGQSPPGNTYNTNGDGLPFFQGKSEFGLDHPTVRKWCSAPTRVAEPGDILMSVRAPVGPTNIADQRCAVGRGLAVIHPRDGIPASLLRHAISFQEDEIASWGTGTTFTAISKRHFHDIAIPLPPREQREPLAELLDSSVALRRSSLGHLHQARLVSERFRQAVLAAACSGRLTADWRDAHSDTPTVETALDAVPSRKRRSSDDDLSDLELPDLPESYVVSTVGRASIILDYGTSRRADSINKSGIPVLRMGNIQDGRLSLEDLKYIEADREIQQLVLKDGDLLFNRTNSPELVGKSAVFHEQTPMTFASYLIRVRFASDVAVPDFVNYWINSAWGKAWARQVKTDGVSQSNINGTKLGAMPLPLPPIEEQREIVRRASSALELADETLARIATASRVVGHSGQATLAKAFRGELIAAENAIHSGTASGSGEN